jgi:hypothetical protein
MNFGQVNAKVADYLNRSDLTAIIPTFTQLAQKRIEREWDYKGMETHASISISDTDSNDDAYISRPTRYKSTKWMKVVLNNYHYPMTRKSVSECLNKYPDLVNGRGKPEMFASVEATDEFLVRPSPDQSYTLEASHYIYSADLSADADTNWLTEDAWECLLFGALLEAAPYIQDKNQIAIWNTYYDNKIKALRDSETKEDISGSTPQSNSLYVV